MMDPMQVDLIGKFEADFGIFVINLVLVFRILYKTRNHEGRVSSPKQIWCEDRMHAVLMI